MPDGQWVAFCAHSVDWLSKNHIVCTELTTPLHMSSRETTLTQASPRHSSYFGCATCWRAGDLGPLQACNDAGLGPATKLSFVMMAEIFSLEGSPTVSTGSAQATGMFWTWNPWIKNRSQGMTGKGVGKTEGGPRLQKPFAIIETSRSCRLKSDLNLLQGSDKGAISHTMSFRNSDSTSTKEVPATSILR